jgi:hypothetical protein
MLDESRYFTAPARQTSGSFFAHQQSWDGNEEVNTMRVRVICLLATVLVLVHVSPAAAQRRRATPVPNEGMWAIGGTFGVGAPSDASLDKGPTIAGTLDGYLTRRVSVRGQLGGGWFDIVGRHFTGRLTPVFLNGNIVYNWEGGVWHPYVTGGLGLYRYHSSETGTQNATDTALGVNVGGGIEYFLNRRTTFLGEALYHHVGDVNTPLATFNGPFWALSAGLKHYF